VRCDHVADLLPGFDDGAPVQRRARRHVEQCLRCQAELVRYRRQRRALASLRAEVVRPPDDLLDGLVVDVGTRRGGRERRRAAYVGGLAAATAAGVGGVLVLATRSRRVAG
jgi:hypothetical protein